MENKKFYISNFSYCSEDKEVLKSIPMLIRRKLNEFDKLALTNILKVYEPDIEVVVFASQYGEDERLLEIIKSYQTENEVSPTQFSASVHNYLTGVLSLSKKLTSPYYAISSGNESLSSGLITSIISNKKTLFCYNDTFNEHKSIACVISNNKTETSIEISFKKETFNQNQEEYKDFIKFLNDETSSFKTRLGEFKRV